MDWLALADKGGTLLLLLVILGSGARKVWVWGYQYQALKYERDMLFDMVVKAQNTTHEALKLVEPNK